MQILRTMQVVAPGKLIALDLHIIDRGNGRECIYTAYIPSVLEEYIKTKVVTVKSIPDHISDDDLPNHPFVWSPVKICLVPGCEKELSILNRSGYCSKHQDQSPERKSRRTYKPRKKNEDESAKYQSPRQKKRTSKPKT